MSGIWAACKYGKEKIVQESKEGFNCGMEYYWPLSQIKIKMRRILDTASSIARRLEFVGFQINGGVVKISVASTSTCKHLS